jgi:urease accessory protein
MTAPAMTALWHLLQTTDTAFPIGGFAHSNGLEGLVDDRVVTDPASLETYLRESWVPALGALDLPLIRHAALAAIDDHALYDLDERASALRPTAESRRAQQQIGRQRLALVARLTAHPRLQTLAGAAERGEWSANLPVVWGVETACLELPSNHALAAYAYQSLNGHVAAAMKLIRIGPEGAQSILRRLAPAVDRAIADSATVLADAIGTFTPLLDLASARHETAYTRLFIS